MGIFSRKRATEASDEMVASTGSGGAYGYDPIDRQYGWSSTGGTPRQVPQWTLEKARSSSIASYRANPMARAILDTYTSFCVGDAGLTIQSTNADVRAIADEFWNDPANCLGEQDMMLRTALLNGELVNEMLVGQISAVVQRSVIDPARVTDVGLDRGNVLWPSTISLRTPGADPVTLDVIRTDMFTELRGGDVFFWRFFRSLETDLRGTPFLMPVLDWLDNYDQVMSNLIDRTALARYLAFHYQLKGKAPGGGEWTQEAIDQYILNRGGTGMPRSGSMEFTNESVDITAMNVQSGSFEDTNTAEGILTSVAAGAGLSKHWMAEPGDVNRATSLSMAEPVRRRVGGVQQVWLRNMTEMVRFAVDRAVAAGRLQPLVPKTTSADGQPVNEGDAERVPASSTVTVVGPDIAAADSNIVATVLVNLGSALTELTAAGLLSKEAGQIAAQKAWEQFTGVPFTPDLAASDDVDEVENAVDDAKKTVATSPVTALISA